MRLLCIGRHPFLSGHISRYFERLGLTVDAAVGLEDALERVRQVEPDVVLVDHDLLVLQPLTAWREDPRAAAIPMIAVSLTRRPEEMLLAPGTVMGSLYLPLVAPADALGLLRLAASRGGVTLPAAAPHSAGAAYAAPGARLAAAAPATVPR
jgi:CheY-like chemotaxis protein